MRPHMEARAFPLDREPRTNDGSSHPLQPSSLGPLLLRWALRREKVLSLLDVHAAREARQLVARCDALSETGFRARADMDWDAPGVEEWLLIRTDVAELLVGKVEVSVGECAARSWAPPPADAAPASCVFRKIA